MRRGDVYLVVRPAPDDPRPRRAVVVVSRADLIDSGFGSVICAPVYSRFEGMRSQVEVGPEVGLQRHSSIFCDALLSVPKRALTNYLGSLWADKLAELDRALSVALGIEDINR